MFPALTVESTGEEDRELGRPRDRREEVEAREILSLWSSSRVVDVVVDLASDVLSVRPREERVLRGKLRVSSAGVVALDRRLVDLVITSATSTDSPCSDSLSPTVLAVARVVRVGVVARGGVVPRVTLVGVVARCGVVALVVLVGVVAWGGVDSLVDLVGVVALVVLVGVVGWGGVDSLVVLVGVVALVALVGVVAGGGVTSLVVLVGVVALVVLVGVVARGGVVALIVLVGVVALGGVAARADALVLLVGVVGSSTGSSSRDSESV